MNTLRGPQENLWKKLVCAVILLTVALAFSSQTFAQLSAASVNGIVLDPSGAVIPNARVVLRNIDTSVENTTVSNKAGIYSIFSITPGRYTIEVTASGFSRKEEPAFTLTVGHIATINFSLAVGAQNSVVIVEGATPQLEASSANLGTVISTKEINDIPLNGRNFTQLPL